MESWHKWLIFVAGIVAVLNHWVGAGAYWLDVIGGLVAAIVALLFD